MRRRSVGIASAAVAAALISVILVIALLSENETPFLSYSEDDYKIIFESGNLTAAVIHAWPRVAFYHTEDSFSPTFDIGMPELYLFNDTNGDGMFVRSEATHIACLDRNHNVSWEMSEVFMGADISSGRYAVLNRSADIALFNNSESMELVVDRWANARFSFTITENQTTRHNELGSYVVQGRIDIQIGMALEIFHKVNSSGVVIEQLLKGGNAFVLTEDLGYDRPNQTLVSASEDETVYGDDFAHRFHLTDLPTQSIGMAKEDGTLQVHYHMSSVPLIDDGSVLTRPAMNCSYFTTGSEMTLHTALMVADANGTITHDMVLGLDEAGFYTGVKDWFTENLYAIAVASGTIAAAVSLILFAVVYRRMRRNAGKAEDGPAQSPDVKPPSG